MTQRAGQQYIIALMRRKNVEDVICMKARALGKPLGLFSSAQNEKATWPAAEIMVSNCHSVQTADEKEERFAICKNNVHDRAKAFDKQYS